MRFMRRLASVPLQYVAALAATIFLGVGIFLLKSSQSTGASPPAAAIVHSPPPSSAAPGGGSKARSHLHMIEAVCAHGRHTIAAISRPATQDVSSPDALRYEKEVAAVLDWTLAEATALAPPSTASLTAAFTVEGRGQRLVDAEIPALERHDLAGARRLAGEATTLTAPADAVIAKLGWKSASDHSCGLSAPCNAAALIDERYSRRDRLHRVYDAAVVDDDLVHPASSTCQLPARRAVLRSPREPTFCWVDRRHRRARQPA
jgi:hypothetical protein